MKILRNGIIIAYFRIKSITLWHKTVNTYYPTQFLWFRNPGRTLLGGSAYGLSWDYSQDVARCTVLESLNEAEGATSKVADSLARQIRVTCRKEALVPHHVELSLWMVECPHNMAAGDPRERARNGAGCLRSHTSSRCTTLFVSH